MTKEGPPVTEEEIAFISRKANPSIHVLIILDTARQNNLTLEEALVKAVDRDGKEHILEYVEAKRFLVEHAERFRITVDSESLSG